MPDGVHEVPIHPVQSPAAAVGDFGDGQLGFDVVCHNHAPPGGEGDDEPPLGEHAPLTVVAVRAAGSEAIFRFPSMSGCLLRSFLVSVRTGRRTGTGPNQAGDSRE
jgi:hypothetical protein